jgi:hypothetical protein
MQTQNIAEKKSDAPDYGWVGLVVGAIAWGSYIMSSRYGPPNWGWPILIVVFAALIGALYIKEFRHLKEFLLSMLFSAAGLFGLWQILLLFWH